MTDDLLALVRTTATPSSRSFAGGASHMIVMGDEPVCAAMSHRFAVAHGAEYLGLSFLGLAAIDNAALQFHRAGRDRDVHRRAR